MSKAINSIERYIAEALITTGDDVSDDVMEWRLYVCRDCEHADWHSNKCTVCGCFLDLKAKSRVNWNLKKFRKEVTHCPLGKWNDADLAEFYKQNHN